jgi:hypothetical protein
MRSVVVDSAAATIVGLLDALAADPPTHFVDYGCGRGAVLREVAKRFRGLPCIGVDCDEAALGLARESLDRAGLRHVTLIEGDVLEHLCLARDIAYCYLGGALNQRLGHALLENGACHRLIAARYPIIGAVPSSQLRGGDVMLYLYDCVARGRLVEWDAPATLVQIPPGTAYLLGRAIRVTQEAELSLSHRVVRPGPARVQNAEFGFQPARPGVPTICDMLLVCGSETRCDTITVIEVTVHADGVPLSPSHLILLRATPPNTPQETIIQDRDKLAVLLDGWRGDEV